MFYVTLIMLKGEGRQARGLSGTFDNKVRYFIIESAGAPALQRFVDLSDGKIYDE